MKVSFDVYSQMCITATCLQVIKSKIGWFDQYDSVVNKQNGMKLIAMQLIPNKYNQDTAWIPTQNQIQTLINQLQPKISITVEDFEDWFVEDKNFYDSVPNLTFEMLFLMYYMERFQRQFWCWGCGFWKDIAHKEQERNTRSKSRIIQYKSEVPEQDNPTEM